jgi:hypothetical protein
MNTTWKKDLNYGLAAFGLKVPAGLPLDEWAGKLTDNPCRNVAAVVGASSVLFYAAERGRNPKVNDIFDAMVYTSTCLSVGYGDIFAKTPFGKVLGSVLMTLGPAVAAQTLDGTANARRDAVQQQTLETLKQILLRLETRRPQAAGAVNSDGVRRGEPE